MANKFIDRSVDEVMDWAKGQIKNPTQDWRGLCQSFCRQAYGLPVWAPSAISAWGKIPRKNKHVGGKPSDAPRGALLYFAGGKYGHVMIAAGRKTRNKAISNDYIKNGEIDFCPRDIPRWGNLRYLGWSAWTPKGELRLK